MSSNHIILQGERVWLQVQSAPPQTRPKKQNTDSLKQHSRKSWILIKEFEKLDQEGDDIRAMLSKLYQRKYTRLVSSKIPLQRYWYPDEQLELDDPQLELASPHGCYHQW